ncbi:hypothetical protein [Pseudomonas veronii]|uniref:Uncharacterized protein n=1 Tax=Pseudomonas veronii TaxID=76761 RepID=A0A6B9XKI6_PSEVE|nr:hypothetical protein [Pseudomonas veronii]QHR77783.1 hypothetical protein E4167_35565 [Pseudomonas veronii]
MSAFHLFLSRVETRFFVLGRCEKGVAGALALDLELAAGCCSFRPCGRRLGRRLGWAKDRISLNGVFFQFYSLTRIIDEITRYEFY